MSRVKYMIGATVVVVSIDIPDVQVTDGEVAITLYYKKRDEAVFQSVKGFTWVYNNFQSDACDNLEHNTYYTMYVSAKRLDGSIEDSPRLTFRTEKLGLNSYVMDPPVMHSGPDYTEQVREKAEYITDKMNAIGLNYGEIHYAYNQDAGTAQASYHRFVHFGTRFAQFPEWDTIVHELTHFFGDGEYNLDSSKQRSLHFNIGTSVQKYGLKRESVELYTLWRYSVDDVMKFHVGADIAFVNINGEHCSELEGSSWRHIFRLKSHNLEKVWIVETQEDCDKKDVYDTEIPTMLYALDRYDSRQEVFSFENLTAVMNNEQLRRLMKKIEFGSAVTTDTIWGTDGYSNAITIPSSVTEFSFINNPTKLPDGFLGNSPLISFVGWDGIERVWHRCFRGSKMQTIDLPASLNYFGAYVFENCYDLQTLILRSTTPPSLYQSRDLLRIPETTTIYVPDESVERYKTFLRAYAEQIHPLSEIEP